MFPQNPYVGANNPIIQGYLQGVQMRKRQEIAQQELVLKQQQQQQAAEQSKAYIAHLGAETEMRHAEIEMERRTHEFNMQQAIAKGINEGTLKAPGGGNAAPNQQAVQQQLSQPAGSDPNDVAGAAPDNSSSPQASGMPIANATQPSPQKVNINGVDIDPSTVVSPQETFQRELNQRQQNAQSDLEQQVNSAKTLGPIQAQQAGATASAKATAEEPFNIASDTRKAANEKALKDQESAASLQRTRMTIEGGKAEAAIHAGATIQAARIGAAGRMGELINPDDPSPSGVSSAITNNALLHATGHGGAALGSKPIDIATKQALSNLGWVDVPEKTLANLNAIHGLDTPIATMKQYMSSMPTDTASALARRMGANIPGTDSANYKNILDSFKVQMDRSVGGLSGRISNQEMQAMQGLVTTPGITKEQATQRMNVIESQIRSKAVDQVLGGIPDSQKAIILKSNGFDPVKIGGTVPGSDGKLYNRFAPHPQTGETSVFNPQTLHYDPINLNGLGGK